MSRRAWLLYWKASRPTLLGSGNLQRSLKRSGRAGGRAHHLHRAAEGEHTATIEPSSGPKSGGTAITIRARVESGSHAVIGGVAVPVEVLTYDTARLVMPGAHLSGPADIALVSPSGEVALVGKFTCE
jgi:hypothetical protein